MKNSLKVVAAVAAVLLVMILPWVRLGYMGDEVALLDCLPQAPWSQFKGGAENDGTGCNLDHRREEFHIPDEILDTTEENVRSVLAGCTVRPGPKPTLLTHVHNWDKVDAFQYEFLDEDNQRSILMVCQDGCIFWGGVMNADFHDKGEAYQALDAVFANIHEVRAFYAEGKFTVAECLPQGQWLDLDGGPVDPAHPEDGGQNVNVFMDRYGFDAKVMDTTAENLRSAFEQCYIRSGEYPIAEGENYFQYDFKTEAGEACRIQVYEGGCVLITLDGVTTSYYDANHSIDVFWNLEARFGRIDSILDRKEQLE